MVQAVACRLSWCVSVTVLVWLVDPCHTVPRSSTIDSAADWLLPAICSVGAAAVLRPFSTVAVAAVPWSAGACAVSRQGGMISSIKGYSNTNSAVEKAHCITTKGQPICPHPRSLHGSLQRP